MDAGDLFLNKRADLEQYLAAPGNDEYNLIAASAILRHFLLEGLISAVIPLANACPTFVVAAYNTFPEAVKILPTEIEVMARWVELRPDIAPSHWPRRLLSMDQFIAQQIVFVRGTFYSVRDVVKLAANAHGGVHLNPPRSALAGLDDANKFMAIDGVPVTTDLLRGIGVNVLNGTSGLIPLLKQHP